jgi:nicotinamide mononucleotide transporter
LPLSWTEAVGALSGALCVWLIVKENVWNWPLGLVNNAFYFAIFYQSRLYADMLLQVFFFAIGVYGWWHWRFGDGEVKQLPVTRTARREWMLLAIAVPVATLAGTRALTAVHDAAPLMDALTTTLSLAAQTLMALKRIEHWWFWIAANALYIPLYVSRELPLTAILYALFLLMCLAGLRQWSKTVARKSGGSSADNAFQPRP